MFKATTLLSFLLIFRITLIFCSSRLTNCFLRRLENCQQNGRDAWKLNVTITTIEKKQYLDGTMIFERDLGDTIRFNTSIQRLTNGKYLHLFSFTENKACNALNKYYGEFLYYLERMGQMIPAKCPIQTGKYHWHNTLIQLEKIPTLASFPFGALLVITDYYEQNKFYACNLMEVELYV